MSGFGIHRPITERTPHILAEEVRFELTAPFGTTVFKTAALNRSATLPNLTGDDYPARMLMRFHPNGDARLRRILVPNVRIERTTYRLQGGCSTTELIGLGSPTWDRTTDLTVNSRLLYR